jgi:hypothetical protein
VPCAQRPGDPTRSPPDRTTRALEHAPPGPTRATPMPSARTDARDCFISALMEFIASAFLPHYSLSSINTIDSALKPWSFLPLLALLLSPFSPIKSDAEPSPSPCPSSSLLPCSTLCSPTQTALRTCSAVTPLLHTIDVELLLLAQRRRPLLLFHRRRTAPSATTFCAIAGVRGASPKTCPNPVHAARCRTSPSERSPTIAPFHARRTPFVDVHPCA